MRNRSIVFIGLLLLLGQLCGNDQRRIQFYYNIAEGNYLIGDSSGAERGIEQSLRLNPQHAPSLALKARIQLEQSDPESALSSIREALQSAPDELEYRNLHALILGQLNRRAEARAQIDAVLAKAEPGSEEAMTAQHLKGLLSMADAKWDEAAAAFKETYQSQPQTSSTGRQLATEAYLEKARTAPSLAEALAAIDQAIALYADTSGRENLESVERLKLGRAKLLARSGHSGEAVASLHNLIGQNAENLEATVTLASIYADQENWVALEDLIEPISRNPQLADIALYLEGRVALSRNRVGTARAKFEEALELNRQQPTALQHALEFHRSICFDRLERSVDAERSLRLAIEGGFIPESSSETNYLGRKLLRIGDTDTLIPVMEKALLRNEANPEGWAMLGRAHLQEEQTTLAISALNQSLSQEPQQAETLALRGSLLRKLGDLPGALVDYERAHELIPSSPVLSYERGLVLLQLGRLEEAESVLRHAARKLSAHVTLDLLHASCACAIGGYAESATSLREYLNPELSGKALIGFRSNISETAFYLHLLLSEKPDFELPELAPPNKSARLFEDYAKGQATRKDVLDWAGRAESPEQARAQICAAAYWLAELEQSRGNTITANELLQIATEAGKPENPEWQFARWQLSKITE